MRNCTVRCIDGVLPLDPAPRPAAQGGDTGVRAVLMKSGGPSGSVPAFRYESPGTFPEFP